MFAAFNPLSANPTPTTSSLLFPENEQAVVLNLEGQMGSVESFILSDNRGEVIYSDNIGKHKKRIKYDLRQLPDGYYTIKVIGENTIEHHQISISKDGVNLTNSVSYKRPFITNLKDRVVVHSSSNSNESIGLSIYNETGDLVYSYDEEKSGDYYKVFNLEKLAQGNYNVVVRTRHFVDEVLVSR